MACDEGGHRSRVPSRKREYEARGDKVWRREEDGQKLVNEGVEVMRTKESEDE